MIYYIATNLVGGFYEQDFFEECFKESVKTYNIY